MHITHKHIKEEQWTGRNTGAEQKKKSTLSTGTLPGKVTVMDLRPQVCPRSGTTQVLAVPFFARVWDFLVTTVNGH